MMPCAAAAAAVRTIRFTCLWHSSLFAASVPRPVRTALVTYQKRDLMTTGGIRSSTDVLINVTDRLQAAAAVQRGKHLTIRLE